MKQTNPNVYPISQDAKMVLLERLKQEISSKVIVDATKNRKRKRGKTTNGGSSVGDGDDAQDGVACASAAADGASDSSPSSKSFATTIVRSRLIVGESIEMSTTALRIANSGIIDHRFYPFSQHSPFCCSLFAIY
jgi:hypothetical protein